jgi:hypothetical protein
MERPISWLYTPTMATDADNTARLDAEVSAHTVALGDFIAAAERVRPSDWNLPRQGDKWSPAQIAEHLRLAYVAINAELLGHGGVRVRTAWWQQRLFRILYLPKILKAARFPTGVKAVREMRPAGGPYEQGPLLNALGQEGDRFANAVTSSSTRASITHPYLGKLTLLDGVRFLAQHTRHHHRQLSAALGPEQPDDR